MKALALLLCAASVMVAPPALAPNSTLYFDGMPPKRYQGDVTAQISLVGNLNEACGTPPPGKFWRGCIRDQTIFMPNPCPYGDQEYARILCHETAHIRGWPATHGD